VRELCGLLHQRGEALAARRSVIDDLRQSLSMVMEQTAIPIELQDRKYGIRVAIIGDKELQRNASFVLAVAAQLPGEALRARFPTQVKIGPVERIRDLVNLQLPGVTMRPLPVAPRQIPYHAGFNYFELDTRNNELWKQLEASGGLAMHIAGEFPGLELEFWAIRG
jgi:type VI secretion system protein ImpJ